jgi:hypothetical protein
LFRLRLARLPDPVDSDEPSRSVRSLLALYAVQLLPSAMHYALPLAFFSVAVNTAKKKLGMLKLLSYVLLWKVFEDTY